MRTVRCPKCGMITNFDEGTVPANATAFRCPKCGARTPLSGGGAGEGKPGCAPRFGCLVLVLVPLAVTSLATLLLAAIR